MDNRLFDHNYDLGAMSEQDMFALSETLNMIEPGSGQDLAINSMGTFPLYEIGVIAVLCVLGLITLNQILRKTSLGEFVRIKLML